VELAFKMELGIAVEILPFMVKRLSAAAAAVGEKRLVQMAVAAEELVPMML
jgi:hypothetical protein